MYTSLSTHWINSYSSVISNGFESLDDSRYGISRSSICFANDVDTNNKKIFNTSYLYHIEDDLDEVDRNYLCYVELYNL